jgi:electron transfer flavoprotein beta subunit
MQIYVCVKHVPDSAVNIKIVDHHHIDDQITFLINPYDEHAITEAVTVRDAHPGSEVIAVCLGPAAAEKTLRSAMAMGADRGLLIQGTLHHDSIETARALKRAIEQDGVPGIIFSGKEAIDTMGMQTLFRIGALFDFPCATNVVRLEVAGGTATVDTEFSGGAVNTYELSLPCVIGAGRGLNTPKYPTFPDVMKSKKKTIKTILLSDLEIDASSSRVDVVALYPLQTKREPKPLTGTAAQVAQEIVRILKQEAKVI